MNIHLQFAVRPATQCAAETCADGGLTGTLVAAAAAERNVNDHELGAIIQMRRRPSRSRRAYLPDRQVAPVPPDINALLDATSRGLKAIPNDNLDARKNLDSLTSGRNRSEREHQAGLRRPVSELRPQLEPTSGLQHRIRADPAAAGRVLPGCRARARIDFDVHRNGDIGSSLVTESISDSNAAANSCTTSRRQSDGIGCRELQAGG